jgi:uncharacterized membrane protein
MSRIRSYLWAVLFFVAIDFVWLGFVAPPLYQMTIGPLLRPEPNLIAAVLFYAIYVVGLVEFVVIPAGSDARSRAVFGRGALLGVFAYATFDLTALAVLANWSVLITVVDLAWGSLLTGSVAALAHRFARPRVA